MIFFLFVLVTPEEQLEIVKCLTMESMSIEEVGDFLRSKGFSEEVVNCFFGQYIMMGEVIDNQAMFLEEDMDGIAIVGAFGAHPGSDCLRDVIPKFGTRIKVYLALKSFMSVSTATESLTVRLYLYIFFSGTCRLLNFHNLAPYQFKVLQFLVPPLLLGPVPSVALVLPAAVFLRK